MASHYFRSNTGEKKPPQIALPRKNDAQQDATRQAVILTTEGSAYTSTCASLTHPREGMYHRGIFYTDGTFSADEQEWKISVIEVSEGGDDATSLVERAISYFHPDILFFISTLYGIRDVRVGDVVTATEIHMYDPGQSISQARTTIWSIHDRLEQRAYAEAESSSWLQRIRGNVPASLPRVLFAPIASGITSMSPYVLTFLRTKDENTLAVEVSEYGILPALQANRGIDTLVICSIAETIQQRMHGKEGCRVAAAHASAFAFGVLAGLDAKKPSQPVQKTATARSTEPIEVIRVFYSYIDKDKDKDKDLVEKLRRHLAMLRRSEQMNDWHAGKINAGADLREQQWQLEAAHLILLFISPDYIDSDYHYTLELQRALERGKTGDATVVPILLRPTNGLYYAGLDESQILPRNGKALTLSEDLDQAFKEVVDEIEKVVKALRSNG